MKNLSVRLDLLDQQIIDSEERPIGRIDDVVLETGTDGIPRVTAVLVSAEVLGERVGGYVGTAMRRTSARMRREAQPPTIPATAFARWSPRIALNVPLRELPHIAGLERWLGEKIVSRIPGAGDARD
jgi:hypothetical protein